jgi:hypothetical protein
MERNDTLMAGPGAEEKDLVELGLDQAIQTPEASWMPRWSRNGGRQITETVFGPTIKGLELALLAKGSALALNPTASHKTPRQ